ncbi:MAG TPA: 3-hydroxybutyryl-CoA dehydrogenase [Vicinamibacterales bacterium]|nr:3-hydroxybutyryl-CoA dehydrogenase [Vicinamibacterales bacterium]
MAIERVGILGCGLMGSGIAQVCAQAGYATIVREVDQAALDRGLARIRSFLDEGVAKGKVAADARDQAWARLSGTTRVEELAGCDLVVEAVVEDLEAKRQAYAALQPVLGPPALLASNTSSLSITELAAASGRPGRFAGLHFFNPVPLMKLVEVVRGLETADRTWRDLVAFARSLGKEPVTAPDRPGFIVNRLLFPYLLDAVRSHEAGLGTVEEIDAAMKLGCGHPMGPFALLDFIGLDTAYSIATVMYEEFRDPAFAPPPLLKRLVLARRLGRKSGHGFYRYQDGPK